MASETLMGPCNVTISTHPDPHRSYQVVVDATRTMGIGKDGNLPWRLPSDLNFFNDVTMTTSDPAKKNVVIMGRKTWESKPLQHRSLAGRLSVVLTRSGSFLHCNCRECFNVWEFDPCFGVISIIERVFVIDFITLVSQNLWLNQCG